MRSQLGKQDESATFVSPENGSAIAQAPVKAPATKAKPAQKPSVTKAKASKKAARPKRSEAELLEILQKADIQV